MVECGFCSGRARGLSGAWASVSTCCPCLLALLPHVGLVALQLSQLRLHAVGELTASAQRCLHPFQGGSCASLLCQTPEGGAAPTPPAPPRSGLFCRRGAWPLSSASLSSMFSMGGCHFLSGKEQHLPTSRSRQGLLGQTGPVSPGTGAGSLCRGPRCVSST